MPSHQTMRLSAGRHRTPSAGACVMELASMLAEEPFSDRSGTVSPVVGAFLRTYNDGVGDCRRQDLIPIASLIVGTAGPRGLEDERAARCLRFARELGGALPRGRAALGMATPEASGTWAALAALRGGVDDARHARVLAFVRELAELRARPRGRFTRMLGDPAGAIAAALEPVSSSSHTASE